MDVQSFVGRQEVCQDIADPARMARLAATLDHQVPPWIPGILPPLGHWLCFQPDARQSAIGSDGHPLRTDDGLLPNVDLPRRMWAGSRIRFLRDISLGAPLTQTSSVAAVSPKSGRSGNMLFVTVRHEIRDESGDPAIVDEHDIVYREASPPGAMVTRSVVPVDGGDAMIREIAPDAVMLFRYSALTFNGHRIHYDGDYCRDVEGYPAPVIHGPLIATLLLDHLMRQRPQKRIAAFSFKATSPLFIGDVIQLGLSLDARTASLRAIGPAGVAMAATVELGA